MGWQSAKDSFGPKPNLAVMVGTGVDGALLSAQDNVEEGELTATQTKGDELLSGFQTVGTETQDFGLDNTVSGYAIANAPVRRRRTALDHAGKLQSFSFVAGILILASLSLIVLKSIRNRASIIALRQLEEEFDASAKELKKVWEGASEDVKVAFSKRFTPCLDSVNCILLFQLHIDRMHNKRGKVENVAEYRLQLQLIRSVCRAATERLNYLNRLECLRAKTGVAVNVLFKHNSLPFEEEEEFVTAADFVAKLRDRGVEITPPTDGTIPKMLADRLINTVEMDFMSLQDDEIVHAAFLPFLREFGFENLDFKLSEKEEAPIPSPSGGMPFATRNFFESFIVRRSNYASAGLTKEDLDDVVLNWTFEEVVDEVRALEVSNYCAIEELQQWKWDSLRKTQEKLRQQLPPSHLYCLAIFLL